MFSLFIPLSFCFNKLKKQSDLFQIDSPSSIVTSSVAELKQAGYGTQVLTDTARTALTQYQEDIDKLSRRLGEKYFGRAQLVNLTSYEEVECCYPEIPMLQGSLAADHRTVNVAAKPTNITEE